MAAVRAVDRDRARSAEGPRRDVHRAARAGRDTAAETIGVNGAVDCTGAAHIEPHRAAALGGSITHAAAAQVRGRDHRAIRQARLIGAAVGKPAKSTVAAAHVAAPQWLARALVVLVAVALHIDYAARRDRAVVGDVEDDLVGFGRIVVGMFEDPADGERVDIGHAVAVDRDPVTRRDKYVVGRGDRGPAPREGVMPVPVLGGDHAARRRRDGEKGEREKKCAIPRRSEMGVNVHVLLLHTCRYL